jgi:ubiquinone/menaquinone biosynthesis C-methylase UbiE
MKVSPIKTEFLILEEQGLSDKSVLEVGCGDGRVSGFLAEKCLSLYGVDTDALIIEQAKIRAPKGTFSVADGQNLPFKDSEFDLIVFSKSLHHHKDPGKALKEALRVLKTGGKIVAIELTQNTEYQKILKPVHDESDALATTAQSLKDLPLDTECQRVDSPKEFKGFNDLLRNLTNKFDVSNTAELEKKLNEILGTRAQEKPLILDAKLDIYIVKK